MTFRKKSVIIIAVILFAMLISACGANTSEKTDSSKDNNKGDSSMAPFSKDFDEGEPKYITVADIGVYIPEKWEYTINEDANTIDLAPPEGESWAFTISPVTVDRKVSLYNDEDLKNLAQSLVSSFNDLDGIECSLVRYLSHTDSYMFYDDEHRPYETIVFDVDASGEKGTGYTDVFYIDDNLWCISYIQPNSKTIDYSYDENDIRGSMFSKELHEYYKDGKNKKDKDNEGKTKEDTSQKEAEDKQDDSRVLYDNYIDTLKSNSMVIDVDDSEAELDGVWIIYVNSEWYSLSKSQKEEFANEVLSQLSAWSQGMYNLYPTVAIENQDGKIVAESKMNSKSMKIKE